MAVPLAAFILFTVIGLWTLQPPAPSANPADDEFSVNRAIEHVRQIASEPHPVGSPAHDRALGYLLEQLRALPLDVHVQHATDGDLRLTNILVRPRNPRGSNIVLLVAHYDSVRSGPGAGDDGAGVATLLETARVLSRETTASNEVAFLFTDGEEKGLRGADAFVKGNPAFLKQVRVVLNFEARGNHGPVTMFETGPNNLELIRLFRSCPYPVATSFAQDVYRRMPNDTDFSVFASKGLIGYNFAVIMGVEHYHQPTDNPQNLSLRSVAHYGSYATTLARKLSQTDLDSLRASQDAVFFPLLRGLLVAYPASWAAPLAIGAWIIYAAILIVRLRQRQLRIGRVLLGLIFTTGICLLTVGACLGGLRILAALFGNGSHGFFGRAMNSHAAALAALSATVLVVLAVRSRLSRRFGAAEMLAGALPAWLTLATITAFKLTGFSYLFLWPAVFGIAALSMSQANLPTFARYSALLCTLVPGCLLFAPAILLAYHALGIPLVPALAGLASLQVFLIHAPDAPGLSTGRIGG